MSAFVSTVTVTDAQLSSAPQLEPAFEHLLRKTSVHERVISILRVNEVVVDRDTFVNMFDSEAALKEGAADLGFNLTSGGLSHKREFARVVTVWKTAKVMADTKLQAFEGSRRSDHSSSVRLDVDSGRVQTEIRFSHFRRTTSLPVDV